MSNSLLQGRRGLVVVLAVVLAVGALLLGVTRPPHTPGSPAESVPPVSPTTTGALVHASGSAATVPSADLRGDVLPVTLPTGAVNVHVPILMYHYVDAQPPPAGPYADSLTVRTDDFSAQMQYLVDTGHHTVTLSDVYLAMAGRRRLPTKPVALTFDDGGLDNYTVAFPELERRGLTATFFVITGKVGKPGQMTWAQLAEMSRRGMSIESHTVSHPDLRSVSSRRLKSELADSRAAIQAALDVPSQILCYPSGAYNNAVIKAARAAGYVMAVSTGRGRDGDPGAVFELKRRRVASSVSLGGFAHLLQH